MAAPRSGIARDVRLVPQAVRSLLLPFYGLPWSLTSRHAFVGTLAVLAVLLAAGLVAWEIVADVDARGAAGATPMSGPPGWLEALGLAVLVGSLLLGVLRGG